MEVMIDFLASIYRLFNYEMTVYGFTFSFWDILMFGLVVSIVFAFVRYVFYES